MQKGKFFVFEGIDGSGKSVQAKLLAEVLQGQSHTVQTLNFPQYGKKSAGLVEEYLAGKYGKAAEVDPRVASVFYAVDRHDLSLQITEWLLQGHTIVSDRYIGSNIGHQGAKFSTPSKRAEFFKWLYDLEYGIFQIPKPTISIFLHVPAKIAAELSEDPERRKTKKKDIHEADSSHLKAAEKAYVHAAKLFPKDFIIVECVERGELLPPEAVHERVWTKIQKYL